MNLPKEQIDFAVDCVSKWIRIAGGLPSSADADHSSLLRRLLDDKSAFLYPPPKMYSYPCYELSEGKPVEVDACDVHSDMPSPFPEGTVSIGQSIAWEWHDKDRQVVKHKLSGDLYSLREGVSRTKQRDGSYHERDCYTLQRIEGVAECLE